MASLKDDEMTLWHAWQAATDMVNNKLGRSLGEVSGADFGVLSRLEEGLRQSELAASLRWDKTRLSHHLTRMEERGLLKRKAEGRGVSLTVTAKGKKLLKDALPQHAEAIREALIERVPKAKRSVLLGILEDLAR